MFAIPDIVSICSALFDKCPVTHICATHSTYLPNTLIEVKTGYTNKCESYKFAKGENHNTNQEKCDKSREGAIDFTRIR